MLLLFHSQQVTGGWLLSLIFLFKPYIKAINLNGSDVVKYSGPEQVYLRYQNHALTVHEMPC